MLFSLQADVSFELNHLILLVKPEDKQQTPVPLQKLIADRFARTETTCSYCDHTNVCQSSLISTVGRVLVCQKYLNDNLV